MTTNDFLPFANDTGATNVDSQANYLAAQTGGGYSQMGFATGIAHSNEVNKAIRQSSVVSAALTDLIVSQLAQNVLDSGGAASITALSAQFLALMQAAAQAAQPPLKPQGRLTLTTNTTVLAADVASATVVYYTACEGDQIPVWSGTQFLNLTFASDLVLTLTAAAAANDIVDVFAINVAGAPVLAFGPVWANSSAGAGSRGSGAGTTQLARQNGLWTNANIITLYNGATTYSAVPANRATYLGSIYADSTAGQVTCRLSFGQSRKWGVWNAYNRKLITLQAGDSTSSWAYNSTGIRSSNNNPANSLSVFTGLPEEEAFASFVQTAAWLGSAGGSTFYPQIGIGVNSVSAFTGKTGVGLSTGNTNFSGGSDLTAQYTLPPTLGLSTINALESCSTSSLLTNFYGTNAHMLLSAAYLG